MVGTSGTDFLPDVGGGSVFNTDPTDLAHTSLTWMLNELIAAGVGFVFKHDAFSDIPVLQFLSNPDSTGIPIDSAGDVDSDPFKTISERSDPYTSSRRDQMITDATAVSISPTTGPSSKLTQRTVSTRETLEGPPVTISSIVDNAMTVDATRPAYDALGKKTTFYWLLELIPMKTMYQDAQGHWHSNWQYVCL